MTPFFVPREKICTTNVGDTNSRACLARQIIISWGDLQMRHLNVMQRTARAILYLFQLLHSPHDDGGIFSLSRNVAWEPQLTNYNCNRDRPPWRRLIRTWHPSNWLKRGTTQFKKHSTIKKRFKDDFSFIIALLAANRGLTYYLYYLHLLWMCEELMSSYLGRPSFIHSSSFLPKYLITKTSLARIPPSTSSSTPSSSSSPSVSWSE